MVLLVAANVGCQPEYRDRDRWPMAVGQGLKGSREVVYLSPLCSKELVALTSPDTAAARYGGWVSCISLAPAAEGFVIFAGHEAFHLRRAPEGWRNAAVGRPGRWVRAACPIVSPSRDHLLALICGGQTQPASGQNEAAGEPTPWLMNGEVLLATLANERLLLGEAELPGDLNAWRIKSGRFAGEQNLLVCVYTRSPFDPIARRRPFVYRVEEDADGVVHLEPRWRGTSFSHPFVDADFGDFSGAAEGEIAALELGSDEGRLLTAYRFEGFGLEGLAPTVELGDPEGRPDVEDLLAAADVVGDDRDELLVHARGGEGGFAAYGLTDDEQPQIVELARAPAPERTIAWVPLERSGRRTGQVACLKRDGAIELMDLQETRPEE